MLVLTRNCGEVIIIGDGIRVEVLDTKGGRVRLGITAPRNVSVHRSEVLSGINSGRSSEVAYGPARSA
ncbi:MAG: carbon storage regulator CsrA [Planctomycetaceae bacterium]